MDHLVLGEAEAIIAAWSRPGQQQRPACLPADDRPDVRTSPAPAWHLIDIGKYVSLSIQYSRGCPFDCDFCDIVLLDGHVPSTKDTMQLIGEMDAIYRVGWRNRVFIVDDNFIGNKKKLKAEVLPAIIRLDEATNYPFTLFTQASIGLSDDEELMRLMLGAGFNRVFIGIETPNEDSLAECGKHQDANRDLVASVRCCCITDLRCREDSSSASIATRRTSSTGRSISFSRAASSPPWSACSTRHPAPGSTSASRRRIACSGSHRGQHRFLGQLHARNGPWSPYERL